MDTMYIVGKKIAHYRKQNNISQQAFAEMCGISIRYLSQIENKRGQSFVQHHHTAMYHHESDSEAAAGRSVIILLLGEAALHKKGLRHCSRKQFLSEGLLGMESFLPFAVFADRRPTA